MKRRHSIDRMTTNPATTAGPRSPHFTSLACSGRRRISIAGLRSLRCSGFELAWQAVGCSYPQFAFAYRTFKQLLFVLIRESGHACQRFFSQRLALADHVCGEFDLLCTVLGLKPRYSDLEWKGIDAWDEQKFGQVMSADGKLWEQELSSHKELFERFGDRMPKELDRKREQLKTSMHG